MFCKTVWNGLHILPEGDIRLCSLGTNAKKHLDMQRCRDKNGNVMNILTHEIKDIMNSDKHREVRKLNMADPTAWSEHCDCCENRERALGFDRNHKNKSRRIYLMRVDTEGAATEEQHVAAEDGSIDWMPSSLDIRFGNLCNQKCIMCGPTYSNMWYDEFFDYYKRDTFGQGGAKTIQVLKNLGTGKWVTPPQLQWFEDPRWWVKFEQMMPYLTHIYITGGEPMVAPAHDIMLDKLIESGYAKNVLLEYDTNCSAVNNKIAQRWFNFKQVDIRGSMDSIESEYEIIRNPGKWEKFKRNVELLKQYEKESNGVIRVLALTSCFQITTAYSVIKSEEWCKSIGVDFHLRFLEGPLHHSITSLPDSEKARLLDYYRPHVATNTKAKMIINYLQGQIGKGHHRPTQIAEFVKFMDYLDSTRQTNWRAVFPEVSQMIERALIAK